MQAKLEIERKLKRCQAIAANLVRMIVTSTRGPIRLHLLHHAVKGPILGLGLLEELKRHGYRISPVCWLSFWRNDMAPALMPALVAQPFLKTAQAHFGVTALEPRNVGFES